MTYVYYIICGGDKIYIEKEYTQREIISLIQNDNICTLCTSSPIYDSLDGNGFKIMTHSFENKWINKVTYDVHG